MRGALAGPAQNSTGSIKMASGESTFNVVFTLVRETII
jgi:hypothetical protein